MPAPKGNKYALGNDGGRPLKFKTAEELSMLIDGYFEEQTESGKPFTMCGLALKLGIDPETLRAYREGDHKSIDKATNEELSTPIKIALLRCQNYAEEQALDPNCKRNPAGAIFVLKNYGWKDTQEVVNVNQPERINKEDIDKLLDEE